MACVATLSAALRDLQAVCALRQCCDAMRYATIVRRRTLWSASCRHARPVRAPNWLLIGSMSRRTALMQSGSASMSWLKVRNSFVAHDHGAPYPGNGAHNDSLAANEPHEP